MYLGETFYTTRRWWVMAVVGMTQVSRIKVMREIELWSDSIWQNKTEGSVSELQIPVQEVVWNICLLGTDVANSCFTNQNTAFPLSCTQHCGELLDGTSCHWHSHANWSLSSTGSDACSHIRIKKREQLRGDTQLPEEKSTIGQL